MNKLIFHFLETANKLVEMYEKQAAHQIKNEDGGVVTSEIVTTLVTQQPLQTHQPLPLTNALPQQQLLQLNPQEQHQQQSINDNNITKTPSPNKDTSTENIDVTTVPILNTQQQSQQQQQQQPQPQPLPLLPPPSQQQQQQQQQQQLQQSQLQQQHQTGLPHQADQSNLNIVLNADSNNLKSSNNDPNNVPIPYNREIPPPNSIYGIESLTSKPYEAEIKQFNDSIQSPRFQNNYSQHITSPHHSSPDRTITNHRTIENNWVSPVKLSLIHI